MKFVQLFVVWLAFLGLCQAPALAEAPRYLATEVVNNETSVVPDRECGHNDHGQRIYNRWVDGKPFAGVQNADGTTFLLDQLPNTNSSQSWDINNHSVVVGCTNYNPDAARQIATLWTPGYAPVDMTPESYIMWSFARSINDWGDVTIDVKDMSRDIWSGIWHDGSFYRLDDCIETPGVRIMMADLINNAGFIAGKGYINGKGAFIKLTPIGTNTIPEPGSFLLLGTGLIGLLGFKKIRK